MGAVVQPSKYTPPPIQAAEKEETLWHLSDAERSRIREEELVKMEVRMEMKRKQAPRLILIAVLWSATLLALALTGPLLHWF